MGAGWAVFVGHAGDNHMHSHHALQLAVAEVGDIAAAVHGHDEVTAPGILIDGGVVHRLTPGRVRLFYVEANGLVGRSLSSHCHNGIRTLSDTERCDVVVRWPTASVTGPSSLLDALGIAEKLSAMHPEKDRVDRVIASLTQRLEGTMRLTELAAESALSPSRFRHLISERVGMPLRPYVRWLRLQRALESAARGASLTEAAQSAGFADAAHLTRTMRRHFGVAPSAILALLRRGVSPFVQDG
jgi:AraC-like DNA-binding protein